MMMEAVKRIKLLELNAMISRELSGEGVEYELEHFGDGAVFRLFDAGEHVLTVAAIDQGGIWSLSVETPATIIREIANNRRQPTERPRIKKAIARIWREFDSLLKAYEKIILEEQDEGKPGDGQ